MTYSTKCRNWGHKKIWALLSWSSIIIYNSQGYEERNQLGLITNLCGSITPEVWPGVEKLQHYQEFILNDKKQHNKLLFKKTFIYLV